MSDATWICPNQPFGHDWNGVLKCHLCDAERTASEAIMSLLASVRGMDKTRATLLVAQHRAEVFDERLANEAVSER